jgi:hypothetical protein
LAISPALPAAFTDAQRRFDACHAGVDVDDSAAERVELEIQES